MSQKSLNKSFSEEDFLQIKTRKDLVKIAKSRGVDISDAMTNYRYLEELAQLQSEMVNLQQWVARHQHRVAVIFEGRDASGKGAPSNGLKNTSTREAPEWWLWPNPLRWNKDNGISGGTSNNFPTLGNWCFLIAVGTTGR